MSRAPITRIVTAPSPATSGTTFTVTEGEGDSLPNQPFTGLVWTVAKLPVEGTNAETVTNCQVTAGQDTVTCTRGSSPISILGGMMFAALYPVARYKLGDTVTLSVAAFGAGAPYTVHLRRPDGGTEWRPASSPPSYTRAAIERSGVWHYAFECSGGVRTVDYAFYVEHSQAT